MRPAAAILAAGLIGVACHPRQSVTSAAPAAAAAPPPGCDETSPAAFSECIDAGRFERTLREVARPRPPGSTHWREVQSLCQETLIGAGFDVELHRYATGTNVIGTLAGDVDETVMLGAHYDHIPGCDGADDNASGVAAVLELARVFAHRTHRRRLLIACWDEEERGLVGSRAWVHDPANAERDIALYINFDAIAYTRDEPGAQTVPGGFSVLFPDEVEALAETEHRATFVAAIANPSARTDADRFAETAERLGLPTVVLEIPRLLLEVPLAIDLRRSDHAPFWDAGIPAVMLTDTANFRSPSYHCRHAPDDVASVDLAFAVSVVRSAAAMTAAALQAERENPQTGP